MSRTANITTIMHRSLLLLACAVAAIVMLVTGHVGWGILTGAVTVGGAVSASKQLSTLHSVRANAAVVAPAVVTIIALIGAY